MTDDELTEHLNGEAWRALSGLLPLVQERLIALFESDVPIDPLVRQKIASALHRTKDETGVRLEVRGTGSGGSDSAGFKMQVRRRWLIAGRHIEQLVAGGMTLDDAKREVTSLHDIDGAAFGYGAAQAQNAWEYLKAFRKFQASAHAHADICKGSDREWFQQNTFISRDILGISLDQTSGANLPPQDL